MAIYKDTQGSAKMSEALDHTPVTEVRVAHRFDESALAAYLYANIEGFAGPLSVRQFSGGQSNPTFLLDAASGRYVLRKQPPGELLPSAHQVDREYRVMHGLGSIGAPVPQMLSLCQDKSVIGTDFYVMNCVEGRVFSDPALPGLNAAERREIYLDLARVLGRIHRVDYKFVGLEGFGRPADYVARQIARWSKQYLLAKTHRIDSMDRLMEWLPERIPDEDGDETASTIVHGDYRLGNTIVHPTEPRIIAVLDWELSTIGNPLADLSYLCQPYHIEVAEEGDENPISGFDPEVVGIPGEQEVIDEYCRAMGRAKVADWGYYIVFNMFRSASILQGVYKRGLDGTASSESAHEYADASQSRANRAWELAQELG